MINPEVIKNIKDAVDVEALLRVLGFKVTKASSLDVRAPCVLHGGDNPTAFSVRLDTKTWTCFTHKCDRSDDGSPQNDLVSLVMKAMGMPFKQAIHFLSEFTGIPIEDYNEEAAVDLARKRDIDNYIRQVNRLNRQSSQLPEVSEDMVLSYINRRDDYFVRAGFSKEVLDTFEVGLMVDSRGIERATIPIRDPSGKLVGLSARRTDNNLEPRYLLQASFQKGKILYNLHNAINTGSDTLIVVEGFKACWAVWESGYGNVSACMSALLTEDQVYAICKAGFINCVLMLDGDEAGRKGIEKSLLLLERGLNTIPVYLPEGKSPDDFSRHELKELLSLYC